jgi:hypothetical protein
MNKEEFKDIISEQKQLNELPNSRLVKSMDTLTEEHERVKQLIINNTVYLDQIEELYNNILKVYQQRTNAR